MVSPHPTTMQLVADAARRERLQHLAAGRRRPLRSGMRRQPVVFLLARLISLTS
jgi:hypothetical protein